MTHIVDQMKSLGFEHCNLETYEKIQQAIAEDCVRATKAMTTQSRTDRIAVLLTATIAELNYQIIALGVQPPSEVTKLQSLMERVLAHMLAASLVCESRKDAQEKKTTPTEETPL